MLSDRYLLAGLCSSAAVACISAMLALAHYGVGNSPSTIEPREIVASLERAAPVPAPAPPRPADRLAYVPDETLPMALPPPAETSEAENQESWSVETRRETPERTGRPQLSVAPPSLPGQATAPSAPSKTYTLEERLAEISPAANKRLAEKFAAAGAAWPPADIGLVAIKDEKVLELFVRPSGGTWTFVHRYPVLAASGNSGPKLRQGDKQVPEGVYGISFLNPNSRYHVSLRVSYPNTFDRQMAARDGRNDLGGDIMIHGKTASVGCLAVGDEAAEELFALAAHVGLSNIRLIIAPTDFRSNGAPAVEPDHPPWLPQLYTEVATAMSDFKAPPSNGLLSFFGN